MGTTSSAIFKGSSAYSSDFANVISRAVAIASLPIQQLTVNKTALTAQSDELAKLDTKFAALQTAIQKVGTALGGSAFQTEVSRDNVVDITVAAGAGEGVYSMNVKDIGAYETSMSTQNWSVGNDPLRKTTFTLVVGNQNYSVTPDDNSAQSVVKAINLNYGNLVQATTVNVGSGDTRMSLKSVLLGQTNLDILQVPSTNPTSLQQAISQTAASWDSSGSEANTYTLTIGGDKHNFTPIGNTADDVADEINTRYGSQVTASVVDLGTSGNHDYRISLASATVGPMNGSMTLDIQRIGGASLQTQTSRTAATWNGANAAAGSRSTYTLVAGANKYTFTPDNNSPTSVAAAINSLYGGQVTASVVDLGTSGSHDCRISLQSVPGGSATFDIQKTTAAHFQEEKTTGALASYEISGVANTSNTRSITISNGVTATLLGISGTSSATALPVDITVTRSTSALGTALSGFADAYNAAVDELGTQRGQSAGPLQGQSVLSQLCGILSSISTYSSSGQIGVLENVGVKLEGNGRLTYNAIDLMLADLSSSASVTAFLGSTTGGGFLKNATDLLSRVENATTGLLKTSQTDVKTQIANLATTIADKQNKVDLLQIRMQNQMALADALIASMQQKSSYFSNMFAAQQSANDWYK